MVSYSRERKASNKAATGWLLEPTPGAKEQEDRPEKKRKQVGELAPCRRVM